jgi:hypothetical protein
LGELSTHSHTAIKKYNNSKRDAIVADDDAKVQDVLNCLRRHRMTLVTFMEAFFRSQSRSASVARGRFFTDGVSGWLRSRVPTVVMVLEMSVMVLAIGMPLMTNEKI